MSLKHGLNYFDIPGGQGFIRVYGKTPAQVELDYFMTPKQVIEILQAAFGIAFSLDNVQIRVRPPIWEFNRKLNTVNQIQAKPVVYKILRYV